MGNFYGGMIHDLYIEMFSYYRSNLESYLEQVEMTHREYFQLEEQFES